MERKKKELPKASVSFLASVCKKMMPSVNDFATPRGGGTGCRVLFGTSCIAQRSEILAYWVGVQTLRANEVVKEHEARKAVYTELL